MSTGTWGATPQGPTAGNPSGDTSSFGPTLRGLQNPGPGVIYTDPRSQLITPANATTAITDPNGNLWCLTTFGTCGSVQPTWPTTPVYPIYGVTPPATATTVTDGSCVWTAINPKGQGMRISSGSTFQTGSNLGNPNQWARCSAPRFKNLSQLINPVPDDYEWAFKAGFLRRMFTTVLPTPRYALRTQRSSICGLLPLRVPYPKPTEKWKTQGFYPLWRRCNGIPMDVILTTTRAPVRNLGPVKGAS